MCIRDSRTDGHLRSCALGLSRGVRRCGQGRADRHRRDEAGRRHAGNHREDVRARGRGQRRSLRVDPSAAGEVVTAMSVDMGAYQETVSKIRGGVGTIEGAIPTLQHGAASLANISPFLIPPSIVNWVIAAINTFLDWVIDVCKFVLDLIEGILAPFFFYGWAGNWRGFLKQGATDAQAIMNLSLIHISEPTRPY